MEAIDREHIRFLCSISLEHKANTHTDWIHSIMIGYH